MTTVDSNASDTEQEDEQEKRRNCINAKTFETTELVKKSDPA